MQITVKFANPAKEGKKYGSVVGQDDVRYVCPANLVGRFQKGNTYDVTVKKEDWDGKDVQIIKGVEGGQQQSSSKPSNGNGDKWWMPFVSNTVAHAIAAGHIKGPGEITTWAKAAKLAAEATAVAVKDVKSFDDMEDDIPL